MLAHVSTVQNTSFSDAFVVCRRSHLTNMLRTGKQRPPSLFLKNHKHNPPPLPFAFPINSCSPISHPSSPALHTNTSIAVQFLSQNAVLVNSFYLIWFPSSGKSRPQFAASPEDELSSYCLGEAPPCFQNILCKVSHTPLVLRSFPLLAACHSMYKLVMTELVLKCKIFSCRGGIVRSVFRNTWIKL